MDENHLAWVGLNLLPLSPRARARLLESHGGPQEVLQALARGADAAGQDLLPGPRARICGSGWKASAEAESRRAERLGITILSPGSGAYPEPLRFLHDPPPALYVLGELRPQDTASVAVVGSRAATPYGLAAAEELAGDLSRAGLVIVSGLALGVDATAHRAALESGGRTVAVLGSGLDVPYPRRNRRLLERVAAAGAVISEFPLGSAPEGWHFPQRNRVIAGLSLGTLVVEASEKSGSLVTAREALDLGREVFAVPGPIHASRSQGTNRLIRDGAAKLVLTATDILEEIGARLPEGALRRAGPTPAQQGLTAEEARLLERIPAADPVQVDDLARGTGLEPGVLLDTLLSLEVKRRVRAIPGGRYLRQPPSSIREEITPYGLAA